MDPLLLENIIKKGLIYKHIICYLMLKNISINKRDKLKK